MNFEIRNLAKSFGAKEVLKSVDLKVNSGEALGLLGRNGAGKTTTIRIILGLFNSDKGEILIDGKPIDRKKIKIGYLPEERGLYPKKKIIEQLIYFAQLKGMKKPEAIKSIDYYLEKLEVTEYRNAKLDTLSKGNQQKIQLIATLVDNPDVIILDEPFSGLDPVTSQLLKNIVIELIGKGKIVLFSSHQMAQIEEFCERIAILNKGRIVIQGDISKIKKTYPRNVIKINSLDNEELIGKLDYDSKIIGDQLIVTLEDEAQINSLIKDVLDTGVLVESINVVEPSLNDIFVEYTKEGI